jgi:hypothetical protein
MGGYLTMVVERASWRRVLLSLALLFGYSFWAFLINSAWSETLAAAGGALPEALPGFPADEPMRSFTLLREANLIDAYRSFQAIDVPFAVLNAFFMWAVLALGVKRFASSTAPVRYLMLLPCVYMLAEFVEDGLLVLLAGGRLGEPAGLVLVQQAATSLKWASLAPTLIIVVVVLLGMIGAAAMRTLWRKQA